MKNLFQIFQNKWDWNTSQKYENSNISQISKDEKPNGIYVISLTEDSDPKLTDNQFNTSDGEYSNNTTERSMELPTLWPQVLTAVACACVHFAVGVVYGYTGGLLPALTNPNSTDIYLDTSQVAIFSSVNNLGTIVGALICGVGIAVVGQRICLLVSLPLGACAWIILSLSNTFYWLVLSRILLGFAVGIYITTCHIFVVEIAYPTVRGRLLSMCDLFRQCGTLFIYILGSTNIPWRTNALVAGLTSIIPPFILLLFLPTSPRWLATVHKREEAKSALTFYRGAQYDVDKELNEIFSQIEKDGCTDGNFLQHLKLFKKPIVLKRVMSLAVIMIFLHLTGNVAVQSYLVTIFKSARTDINEYVSTILSGSMRIFGALTYTIFADRFRRKVLLNVPLCLSGVSIAVLGLYFYFMAFYDIQDFSWVPLASLVAYSYFTGMYYPVVMLLKSELLPNAIRAVASGLNVVLLSLGMFVIVFSFPYMLEHIGDYLTYWIYGITCFVLALFVICVIPETKDRTLEEIEEIR